MTALWISLAAIAALVLAWRLNQASKRLARILDEELAPPAAPDRDEHRAEHRKP
jgi:hypothetical protein